MVAFHQRNRKKIWKQGPNNRSREWISQLTDDITGSDPRVALIYDAYTASFFLERV